MDEQKDDLKLYNKINKKGNQNRIIYKPKIDINYNFLNWYKREELLDIANKNRKIFWRLNAKNSYYTLNSHLRDYEKAQYYKKNYCKYPSIDFYRTSKSSSFCSIFNYCTFNNYNNINNAFLNDYNNRIKFRNNKKNKSCENFTKMYTFNKERQKKVDDIVNNHYTLKYYYEEQKKDDEIEQKDKNEEDYQENQKENQKNNFNKEINNNISAKISDDNINDKRNIDKNNSKKINIVENNNNNNQNSMDNNISRSEHKDNDNNQNKKNEKEKDEDLPLLAEILIYGKDEEMKNNSKIKRNSIKNDDAIAEFNGSKNNDIIKKEYNDKKNEIKDDDDDIISDIMGDIKL